MKTRRNLSGIYMRHQDKSGKWGNICFEDMSETEIDDLILNMNDKYKDNMNDCDGNGKIKITISY